MWKNVLITASAYSSGYIKRRTIFFLYGTASYGGLIIINSDAVKINFDIQIYTWA